MYKTFLRPLLFCLPPTLSHELATSALGVLEHVSPLRGMVRALLATRDEALATEVMGLRFPSPVGIAGGFDKNAFVPRALAALGFGFLELGTVTALAQAPNPSPNMFRLPDDRALVNRLGFPNEGAERVTLRLAQRRSGDAIGVPVGMSIGKSRVVDTNDLEAVVADYRASYAKVRPVSDFVVVNVSSPNTTNLRALQGADVARVLLSTLVKDGAQVEGDGARRVPLLVKIAPDLSDADLDALLAVVDEAKIDGVVATNTTIRRDGLASPTRLVESIGTGGLSGPPLRARSLEVVKRARARLGRERAIVGVGGIETGDDAWRMLEAGADLVQLYTGLIYEGPTAPRRIARGIASHLARLGARSLTEWRTQR